MEYLKKSCVALVFTAMLAITPAIAQQAGLVNVDLSGIKVEVAKNLNVDVSQVPVTVQVPVDVAATVCDVNAAVLANQAKSGGATCTAKNDTSALNTVIQNQISNQTNKK